MINVVLIRELDPGAHFNRQKSWMKSKILLCHFPQRESFRFREFAFQIDHGPRRIGLEHAAFAHDLVAFVNYPRGVRFG